MGIWAGTTEQARQAWSEGDSGGLLGRRGGAATAYGGKGLADTGQGSGYGATFGNTVAPSQMILVKDPWQARRSSQIIVYQP